MPFGACMSCLMLPSLVGKMSAILPIRQGSGTRGEGEIAICRGKLVPPVGIEPTTPGLGNLRRRDRRWSPVSNCAARSGFWASFLLSCGQAWFAVVVVVASASRRQRPLHPGDQRRGERFNRSLKYESTSTSARSPPRPSWPRRCRATSSPTTKSDRTRLSDNGDPSSCTAKSHTYSRAKSPRSLTRYTSTKAGESSMA